MFVGFEMGVVNQTIGSVCSKPFGFGMFLILQRPCQLNNQNAAKICKPCIGFQAHPRKGFYGPSILQLMQYLVGKAQHVCDMYQSQDVCATGI